MNNNDLRTKTIRINEEDYIKIMEMANDFGNSIAAEINFLLTYYLTHSISEVSKFENTSGTEEINAYTEKKESQDNVPGERTTENINQDLGFKGEDLRETLENFIDSRMEDEIEEAKEYLRNEMDLKIETALVDYDYFQDELQKLISMDIGSDLSRIEMNYRQMKEELDKLDGLYRTIEGEQIPKVAGMLEKYAQMAVPEQYEQAQRDLKKEES